MKRKIRVNIAGLGKPVGTAVLPRTASVADVLDKFAAGQKAQLSLNGRVLPHMWDLNRAATELDVPR